MFVFAGYICIQVCVCVCVSVDWGWNSEQGPRVAKRVLDAFRHSLPETKVKNHVFDYLDNLEAGLVSMKASDCPPCKLAGIGVWMASRSVISAVEATLTFIIS